MISIRTLSIHRLLGVVAAVAIASTAPSAVYAQQYPERPVRLIVQFPPGGTTDILARIVSEGLAQQLEKPFVVENRAGASGMIGSDHVARAKDGGHTLGMATVTTHAINPFVHKLSFDVEKDLVPISNLAFVPNVLVINPSLGVKTLPELVERLKKEPGKYAYASSGAGAEGHVAMVALTKLTGTDALHVPYKGSGPAIADTIAGHTQIMAGNLPSLLPQIQAGKLTALALTSAERLDVLPEVPTYTELGLPEMARSSWFGLVAPAATPPEVVKKLNEAVTAVLEQPATQQAIAKLGATPAPGSAEEFSTLMADERRVQKDVVSWAKIQP